jgi:hypothetical protein
MYRLIIEHIVKQVFRETRSASATTKAKRKLLSSEYGSKFLDRKDQNRIGNPTSISDKEFKEILKTVFKLEDKSIKSLAPGEGSLSGKFITYKFPFEGSEATIVLAGKGKEESERQERGLMAAIKSVSGDKTLVFKNRTLKGVTEADKATQKGEGYSAQPYADIDLVIQGKVVKVSAKGLSSPTLGGGGLIGLDHINNPAVNSFVEEAYDKLAADYQEIIDRDPRLKGRDLQGNKLFADYYALIPPEAEIPILRGTEDMGGPIDYMYVGSMDVGIEVEGSTITIDGYLYTLEEFVKQGAPLYIRISKRKGPRYFTTERNTKLKNIDVPKIFAIKPDGSGQTQSRLFVTNRATKKKDYQP